MAITRVCDKRKGEGPRHDHPKTCASEDRSEVRARTGASGGSRHDHPKTCASEDRSEVRARTGASGGSRHDHPKTCASEDRSEVRARTGASGGRGMTDEKSGTRSSVGLLDIAAHVPGLLMDLPTIVSGVITGFGARPSAKTSIGKVFQDRADRHADKVFIKFADEQITYREANQTVNRYAAVLAARAVGHGDVVGIMLRNSPQSVLLMLATVKCGAIAGLLNYHQRGDVLKHSFGLLGAKAVV